MVQKQLPCQANVVCLQPLLQQSRFQQENEKKEIGKGKQRRQEEIPAIERLQDSAVRNALR
eukprot:5176843-Ditylum_brightwellii.AAC.1